jgi:hypothetical protein
LVTQHPRRRILHLAAGAAALPATSRFAWAQAYPTRPITMIVPFAAGTSTDVVGRLVAERMGTVLGQPIVIENVAEAQRAGLMRYLNIEYKQRRQEALARGRVFMPYSAARSRLKKAVVEVAAGKAEPGIHPPGVRRPPRPAIGPRRGPSGAADWRGCPLT